MIQWTTFTALGLATGLVGGVLLGMPLAQIVNAMIVTAAVTFVAGTILGIAQALVLRRQLPEVKRWIPATAVALAIALSASSLAVDLSGMRVATGMGAAVFVVLSGIAFGALTSAPLRRTA